MTEKPIPYRRLPGRRADLMARVGLYAGPDHLLLVMNTGFTEYYRRFYYRHLQAIILRRTNASMGYCLGLGLGAAFVILVAAAAGDVGGIIFGVLGVGLLLAWIYNIFLGPTCVVYFRTAVQTQRIPTLTRVRTAHRCFAEIRALIRVVQGTIPGPASQGSAFTAREPSTEPLETSASQPDSAWPPASQDRGSSADADGLAAPDESEPRAP